MASLLYHWPGAIEFRQYSILRISTPVSIEGLPNQSLEYVFSKTIPPLYEAEHRSENPYNSSRECPMRAYKLPQLECKLRSFSAQRYQHRGSCGWSCPGK